MKQYWQIPGPSKAPQSPCVAFYKYDGSNIRAEWSKKRSWYKFGSKHVLLDETNPILGPAIDVFKRTYGESLEKTFLDNKEYRSAENITVFFEFFGPNSFAGYHVPEDEKKVVLFDVNVHKKGFLLPRDFLKNFGHLPIAEVVYEGNFGPAFVKDVWEGKYDVGEGVVAKGIIIGKKSNEQHGLWMAKAKTKAWIDELRKRAILNPSLIRELDDNLKEQTEEK